MIYLIRLATSFGIPERWRKAAGAVFGVVGLLILAGLTWGAYALWLGAHDRRVITQDRAVSNAEVLNTQISAERQAGADKATRDDQFATNQTEVKEATDAAASNSASPLDVLFSRLR
jgi:hypothetical protein